MFRPFTPFGKSIVVYPDPIEEQFDDPEPTNTPFKSVPMKRETPKLRYLPGERLQKELNKQNKKNKSKENNMFINSSIESILQDLEL
jgi:hypothetical protein